MRRSTRRQRIELGSFELWPVDAWFLALLIGLPVLGRIVIVWFALRGTKPAERPEIIAALAELFRWWRRTGSSERHD